VWFNGVLKGFLSFIGNAHATNLELLFQGAGAVIGG
jgi:hypothetical protein